GQGYITGAPGRVLDRRRLALPVCLSLAVRTGAPLRPHRLSCSGCAAITGKDNRFRMHHLRTIVNELLARLHRSAYSICEPGGSGLCTAWLLDVSSPCQDRVSLGRPA